MADDSKPKNERVDARFDLPDTITVRQQLAIKGRVIRTPFDDLLPMWWEVGKEFMTGWQSDIVADPKAVDLDTESDPEVTNVVMTAALMVADWFGHLGHVEKN